MKQFAVTIVVSVYNVESVLNQVLQSIVLQTYPVREVLLIDNRSTDQSVVVADKFIKQHKRVPMRIIRRDRTYGISESYNLGAKLAKTDYIVTLHSDSMLPTRYELARLMVPLEKDPHGYIAAMPIVVHRKKEWEQYNFWQKCLFAHIVGRQEHALSGNFDAYKRAVFLSLGGYDTKHFNNFIGSEDADMHFRLKKAGNIAKTNARVVHMHVNDPSYRLGDWLARRKFLAISYGRQLQLHVQDMGPLALAPFFVKPALALVSVLALWNWVYILPLLLFPFFYMSVMFRSPETNRDSRILLLPFIIIFLVFYETYFMLYSFWFFKERRV